MKHFAIIFLLIPFSFSLSAQGTMVPDSTGLMIGQVYDRYNERNVSYAHIVNRSRASGTITDSAGVFYMTAARGDTLFVSAMGYQFDIVPIDKVTSDTSFFIYLVPRAYLLPEVVIHELNTYARFRDRFVEIQLEDEEIDIPGIPHLKPRSIPRLQDTNYIRNPLFAINSPISFLYYNLSRKEKNKRKYYEVVRKDILREEAENRIDTAIIMRITGIERFEVDDFLRFCNFEPARIAQMTDYEFYQLIRKKYAEYRK